MTETQHEWDEAGDPPRTSDADSVDEAVFIGEQVTGTAIAIGHEDRDEWLKIDAEWTLELSECE